MSDKKVEFVDGLFVDKPHDKAPDFIKCSISIKRSALISWLSQKEDDRINIDVKESKAGKWYASVNDFKPNKQDVTAQQNQGVTNHTSAGQQGAVNQTNANQQSVVANDFDDSDIPF